MFSESVFVLDIRHHQILEVHLSCSIISNINLMFIVLGERKINKSKCHIYMYLTTQKKHETETDNILFPLCHSSLLNTLNKLS